MADLKPPTKALAEACDHLAEAGRLLQQCADTAGAPGLRYSTSHAPAGQIELARRAILFAVLVQAAEGLELPEGLLGTIAISDLKMATDGHLAEQYKPDHADAVRCAIAERVAR